MAIWRNTTYVELDGSPTISGKPDDGSITRRIQVVWDGVERAQYDFLGSQRVNGDGPGADGIQRPYTQRVTPHSCCLPGSNPAEKLFYAVSIPDIKPVGLTGFDAGRQLNTFRFAHLTILYKPLSFRVREDNDPALYLGPARNDDGNCPPPGLGPGVPDEATLKRYVTIVPKPFSRIITLPRGIHRWVPEAGETTAPVMESISKPEGGEETAVSQYWLPFDPSRHARPLYNTVNRCTFLGWAPGTLLFKNVEVTPMMLPYVHRVYNAGFHFVGMAKIKTTGDGATPARPRIVGHNFYLRFFPTAGGRAAFYDYRELSSDGTTTGTKPFRMVDFAPLFRPPADYFTNPPED